MIRWHLVLRHIGRVHAKLSVAWARGKSVVLAISRLSNTLVQRTARGVTLPLDAANPGSIPSQLLRPWPDEWRVNRATGRKYFLWYYRRFNAIHAYELNLGETPVRWRLRLGPATL